MSILIPVVDGNANDVVPANGLKVQVVDLTTLDPKGMPVGTSVVDSTSTEWVLTVSTATVDHTAVEAVAGCPGLRWVAGSGGGSTATDALGTLLTTGYTRCGIAVAHSKSFVDGFANLNNWKLTGGLTTPAATVFGGAVQTNASITMTLNSFSPTDSSGVPLATEIPRLVSVDGTTPFWVGIKFRIITVGNGSSFFLFGFRDPANNKGAEVGYFGATSTTNYAAWRFDGTNQDAPASTVAIDAGWHTAELWCAGAGYFFSIDNETPIGIANGTHPITGAAATLMWNFSATGGAAADLGAVAAIWGTPY